MGTIELLAVLIFLLKSYFTPGAAVNPELLSKVTLFWLVLILEIYTVLPLTTLLPSLSRISTESPIFKLDRSILLVKVKLLISSI